MREYHKIQSVFKRDPDNNYRTFLTGEWTTPEFEYLQDAKWRVTEKIDGTNMRIIVTQTNAFVMGRTERADIHKDLLAHCQEVGDVAVAAGMAGLTLYGEGYGAGIQKGGGDYRPDKGFILFDVAVSETGQFLQWADVKDIAWRLDIPIVHEYEPKTLFQAVYRMAWGHTWLSMVGDRVEAEGIVLRPMVELLDGRGNRVITKLKHKDFASA